MSNFFQSRISQRPWNPWGMVIANKSSTLQNLGALTGNMIQTAASSANLNGEITAVSLSTTAVSGNWAGLTPGATGYVVERRQTPFIALKFRLSALTSERFFVGLTDSTDFTTFSGSDDDASAYCGIQFSTPRADVNFQFVRKSVFAGSQTLTDTLVPAASSTLYMLTLEFANSSLYAKLYNMATPAKPVLLWEEAVTTNLFSTSLGTGLAWVLATQAVAAKTFSLPSGSGFITRN